MPRFDDSDIADMLDTDGLAVLAVYQPGTGQEKPVAVIFDDKFAALDMMTGKVGSTDPRIMARASDLPGVAPGDVFAVDGANYAVVGPPEPDGTGFVTLTLMQAQES
jgi:hypothetical protein